jgi:P2-related tail formation protein
MQNEVTEFLPACYRQGDEQEEIAIALTQGLAEKYVGLMRTLATYQEDYLEPATCKEEWLDVLAYWSGWGELWDGSWLVEEKRSLLLASDQIWSNRGNKDVLEILFNIFGLTVKLRGATGFILNTTTFPGGLGVDPFTYLVSVPTTYVAGSPELKILERLLKDFLPCWISLIIQLE